MITVILAFCVLILLNELAKYGDNPLSLSDKHSDSVSSSAAQSADMSHEYTLYFATADGRLLTPEKRRIPRSEYTVDNCRAVLKALIDGPREQLTSIIPSDAAIKGLYMLKGGLLVIDLSREVEQGLAKSASAEGLMVYGIVDTLTQGDVRGTGTDQPDVRRVRFLFEGSPAADRFPRHLDFSAPVSRNENWLAPAVSSSTPHA